MFTGCTLLKYCHKRDPLFYNNTLFTIDGFHQKGHKSCSASFTTLNYKRTCKKNRCAKKFVIHTNNTLHTCAQLKLNLEKLAFYCSQAVEQNNWVLKRLVSSVSYMSPSNFKMVMTIFMAAQNFVRRIINDDGTPGEQHASLQQSCTLQQRVEHYCLLHYCHSTIIPGSLFP